MKLQKVKTEADVLAALRAPAGEGRKQVELVTKDGTITGLRIGLLHCTVEQYNVLTVHREVPYEEAKRYKLVAKVQGFAPATSYHETSYERSDARKAFGPGTEFEEADNVPVLLDDNGTVVGEAGEGTPVAASDDDITF
jgi:hypothetical protein